MPLPLYPRERAPGTHFTGGWVDSRAGLEDMEKWQFLTPQGLELRLLGRAARRHEGEIVELPMDSADQDHWNCVT
jgi:hypothetical protein